MSNSVAAQPNTLVSSENRQAVWGKTEGSDDFEYVPISPWAPISLVMGAMAVSGFFGIYGLVVALFASIVGLTAVLKIRQSIEPVTGQWMAVVGTLVAVLSLTLGTGKMAMAYSTECPDGFQRVNFSREISDKQFIYLGSKRKLHPDVLPLVDQKIFLKGFMWQTKSSSGLTEFTLLKDNGECCFGGKAQPYDMMNVVLSKGTSTDAYTSMVAVAGTLRVNLDAGEDEAVYIIEDATVGEAQTGF
ncbi:MAG: hypothetical protein KDA91_07310 [Planctomycetaceae bacterium]|nr:hypothetical protein [Planctomycetaceae bacterium]